MFTRSPEQVPPSETLAAVVLRVWASCLALAAVAAWFDWPRQGRASRAVVASSLGHKQASQADEDRTVNCSLSRKID
jgi:hypothetical protein